MDKFYTQHQFSRDKTARPANPHHVFGVAELASRLIARRNSDSPRALDIFDVKGTQKHNVYLPKFVNLLKNFPIIFPQIHIN